MASSGECLLSMRKAQGIRILIEAFSLSHAVSAHPGRLVRTLTPTLALRCPPKPSHASTPPPAPAPLRPTPGHLANSSTRSSRRPRSPEAPDSRGRAVTRSSASSHSARRPSFSAAPTSSMNQAHNRYHRQHLPLRGRDPNREHPRRIGQLLGSSSGLLEATPFRNQGCSELETATAPFMLSDSAAAGVGNASVGAEQRERVSGAETRRGSTPAERNKKREGEEARGSAREYERRQTHLRRRFGRHCAVTARTKRASPSPLMHAGRERMETSRNVEHVFLFDPDMSRNRPSARREPCARCEATAPKRADKRRRSASGGTSRRSGKQKGDEADTAHVCGCGCD